MKRYQKIFLGWFALICSFAIAIYFLPHKNFKFSGISILFLYALLGIITFYILKSEPNKRYKTIFLNFLFLFSVFFPGVLYNFVGAAFLKEKYATFFAFQYYVLIFYFLLALAVIYIVVDLLFNEFKIYQKYIATFSILLIFYCWYFFPILMDPLYSYKTEEIKQWKELANVVGPNTEVINTEALAKTVNLKVWKDGVSIGDLNPNENLRRIEELAPYLAGSNFIVLLDQPLYKGAISLNVMLLIFLMLYFGYQYKKDPPQGAYLDKIMFSLLLFISTDILHMWGFIKSVEWASIEQLFTLGQYVTCVILFVMILFFSLRLQFISSVHGEFYETELGVNPQNISRWRDWIDNLVLSKFFNIKPFHGRLFQRISK